MLKFAWENSGHFEGEREGQLVTATIPDDIAPADLTNELAEKLITQKSQGPQSLGIDPESGLPIFLLIGPFGPYLQLGEMKDGEKPRRVSIPKTRDVSTVKLEDALEYMKLPKTLGPHPETGKVVKAGIGMYGPYVHHDKTYKSLDKTDDILQMTMERALELLAQARVRVPVAPLKELGAHPVDGDPVQIFEGKYGPYIKHGKTNATIPKDRELDSVTIEEAVRLLDERVAKGGGSTGRRGGKKVTKKAAAKKAAASAELVTPKKAAPKKKAAKKATKKSVT